MSARRPGAIWPRSNRPNARAAAKVDVALVLDLERIAIVGAERDRGPGRLAQQWRQRRDVLRDAALADQKVQALGELLRPLLEERRLVVGAWACGRIGIEVVAAHQRRVAVDVPARERHELVERHRVLREHPREIHHLGKPEPRGMAAQGQKILREQPRARGLEVGCRHAGAELHLQRHAQGLRGVEEVADALHPEHVGDLVRIADRGGGAPLQHLPVEFRWRHEAALDVDMGVDKARRRDQASAVDLARAAVLVVSADNPVAADRDVARVQRAGRDVQDPRSLDHQIRRLPADPLVDPAGELVLVHPASPVRRHCSAGRQRDQSPRPLAPARTDPYGGQCTRGAFWLRGPGDRTTLGT
jgi:hypothetical protein